MVTFHLLPVDRDVFKPGYASKALVFTHIRYVLKHLIVAGMRH